MTKQEKIRDGIVVRLMAADEGMSVDEAEDFWLKWKRALLFEPYADGQHFGDCTKEPQTCMRCLVEDYYRQADEILQYEVSQGVVIKAERELPSTYLGWRKIEKKTNKMPDYGGGMFEENVASVQDKHTKKVMRDAGYEATEPLIEKHK